jgi:predicted NAD-dependent protein-ADP-ribosyltransferase YbiA (DUF1768 family)
VRLSNEPVDPDREAVYQAERARIAAQWTPEQAEALGRRLARYRENRLRAESVGAR